MRYSPEFIDKVRDSNNLVEIVGQYTELKGNGHRMMGRCPFPDHSDKSPSFSLSEESQLYFCYGCKKGGNAYTFLETFNGMSFPEAVEYLARRASIPLPERDASERSSQGPSREKKDVLLKVNRAAAVFYHKQLKALAPEHPAKQYLLKRGLSDETVETFRLGVALSDWQNLADHLRTRQAPIAASEALGLLRPKKTQKPGDTHYDLYRERLMFPIFSAVGDVIGFGGRTLGDALPKYINSSDSPVFNKGKVLYGIHETGRYIRAQDSAIVVEGYMDAIALYVAGIKNVVAILGTAFTPEHAKVLRRYTLNVTMLLDGDEAGLGGAERSLPILLAAGLIPRGLVLPDKMDPDDFIRKNGAERLLRDIERAPELFILLLKRRWMENYRASSGDKVRVVEEAALALSRSEDRRLVELYMIELARELEVDLAWVRRAFNAKSGAPVTRQTQPEPETPIPPTEEDQAPLSKISLQGAPRDEIFVLSLLLHREELLVDLLEADTQEVLEIFTHPGVRQLIMSTVERYRSRPEGFATIASALVDKVDQPTALTAALQFEAGEAGGDGNGLSGASADGAGLARRLLGDYLAAIRRRAVQSQLKKLAKQIREEPTNEKLEEFMAVQRERLGREKE